ncbi:hypothetical protein [Porphyromonas levii]|uniref:hypothetical protein n=1 Tax=Porphyromonas levii TaxID=28114 RepID=UPI001B8D5E54|nr:hypothetical protein [Porphyromonas levii]MBR8759077.1 hypothetical protein [Porphyromonas levii]MBR8762957.1 hypothetical protein [Porphyromonas levii]
MRSEIGSFFWFEEEDIIQRKNTVTPYNFGFSGDDYCWLSTGRQAIDLALSNIISEYPTQRRKVMLPPYTCESVVTPFKRRTFSVSRYSLTDNLLVSAKEIIQQLEEQQPSILLFHSYFGFDTISDVDKLVLYCHEHNIATIEDCTHSVFSNHKSDADFVISSIRKWCGVPDGAFLIRRKGKITNKPQDYHSSLVEKKLEASRLKRDYIQNKVGKKTSFLELYSKSEDLIDSQTELFTISPISKIILSNLDIGYLRNQRRTNFELLTKGISSNQIRPLFNALPLHVTPLFFPLICENRKYIQKTLFSKEIYAPIIWPIPQFFNEQELTENERFLYSHLLCIPIDQRYDAKDMRYTLNVLNQKL